MLTKGSNEYHQERKYTVLEFHTSNFCSILIVLSGLRKYTDFKTEHDGEHSGCDVTSCWDSFWSVMMEQCNSKRAIWIPSGSKLE